MTLKQRIFIKKYMQYMGNGARAALTAYDTSDPCVAAVIACQNLSKPVIRQEVDEAIEEYLSRN